ncbi:hypothetical protein LINPERHAP1_LOCUS41329, partial [Linum perenne]
RLRNLAPWFGENLIDCSVDEKHSSIRVLHLSEILRYTVCVMGIHEEPRQKKTRAVDRRNLIECSVDESFVSCK